MNRSSSLLFFYLFLNQNLNIKIHILCMIVDLVRMEEISSVFNFVKLNYKHNSILQLKFHSHYSILM